MDLTLFVLEGSIGEGDLDLGDRVVFLMVSDLMVDLVYSLEDGLVEAFDGVEVFESEEGVLAMSLGFEMSLPSCSSDVLVT